MNNFLTRTVTAILFVAVTVSFTLYNPYTYFALFALIASLAAVEYFKLIKNIGCQPPMLYSVLLTLGFYTLNFAIAQQWIGMEWLLLSIISFFSFPIIELFKKNAKPYKNIAFNLLGIVYVALPFSSLHYLVFQNMDGELTFRSSIIIGMFIALWSNDTGAYLVGSALGRHKLLEHISPNKTWEGAIGGILTACIGALVSSFLFDYIPLAHWFAISIIIAIVGTLGDLSESMLKRIVKVKDSGSFLPGHGGILDRFDSFMFSAPIVLVYFEAVKLFS